MRLFLKLTTLPFQGKWAKPKRVADVLRLPFSPEKGGAAPKSRDGGGELSVNASFAKENYRYRKTLPPQSPFATFRCKRQLPRNK